MSGLASEILGSLKMTSWTYEVLETGEVKDALGKNYAFAVRIAKCPVTPVK